MYYLFCLKPQLSRGLSFMLVGCLQEVRRAPVASFYFVRQAHFFLYVFEGEHTAEKRKKVVLPRSKGTSAVEVREHTSDSTN